MKNPAAFDIVIASLASFLVVAFYIYYKYILSYPLTPAGELFGIGLFIAAIITLAAIIYGMKNK